MKNHPIGWFFLLLLNGFQQRTFIVIDASADNWLDDLTAGGRIVIALYYMCFSKFTNTVIKILSSQYCNFFIICHNIYRKRRRFQSIDEVLIMKLNIG